MRSERNDLGILRMADLNPEQRPNVAPRYHCCGTCSALCFVRVTEGMNRLRQCKVYSEYTMASCVSTSDSSQIVSG